MKSLRKFFGRGAVFGSLAAMLCLWVLSSSALGEERKFSALSLEPFGFQSGQKSRGIYVDILREVVRVSDLDVWVNIVPVTRLLRHMKSGAISCSILFEGPSFKDQFEPVEKIGKELHSVVLFRKDLKIEKISDLEGYRLGVLNGVRFSSAISENTSIEKLIVNNYAQGVKMLHRGRLDAMLGTYDALVYSMLKQNIDLNEYADPYILSRNDLYLMCNKNAFPEEEKVVLRKTIRHLRDSGFIEDVWNSYLVAPPVITPKTENELVN